MTSAYPYAQAPIGLTAGPLNTHSVLPPPSTMVGANVRSMQYVSGSTGCGQQLSPFWSPDANSNYACGSCGFGVDSNKALKYGSAGAQSQGGCGGMGPAAMCGQNPCGLSIRSIDDAFEDITSDSVLNSLYQSDAINYMSLSSTKGSYGYSMRAAPCSGSENAQNILQGTFGQMALVGQSRFFVGP